MTTILFMFIKHNPTLVATWTFTSAKTESKTVLGCVIGQPVLFIYSQRTGSQGWCNIAVTAGADTGIITGSYKYMLGTIGAFTDLGSIGSGNEIFVAIPTTTSVTVSIGSGGYDIIRVYKT